MLEDASWCFWWSAPTPDSFGVTTEISVLNSSPRSSRLKFVGTLAQSYLGETFREYSTILKAPIETEIWGQLSGVRKGRTKGNVIKQLSRECMWCAASRLLVGVEEFWCQKRQRITPCLSCIS